MLRRASPGRSCTATSGWRSTPASGWCSGWPRSGTLVQAIANRRRGILISAAVGFIGVLGAGFNGGSYLNYHEDFSSMIMATGFAVAVVAYSAGLYLASETTQTADT